MTRLGGGAYSASWWRKLVRDGPWGDRDQLHPPTYDKLDGIAQLFQTTPQRVAQMIAVDWYGVQVGIGFSARVKRLISLIDSLSDRDTTLMESLLCRLSEPLRLPSPFYDKAREIGESGPLHQSPHDLLAERCGYAYSATWWRRLLTYKAWGDQSSEQSRLLPPTYDKLDAIAKAFETAPEHVAKMIVVDWYGVQAGITSSARAESFSPMIDRLSDEDIKRVKGLLRRLSEAR